MATGSPRAGWLDAFVAWFICLIPRLAAVVALWPNVRLDTSSTDLSSGVLLSDIHWELWPPAYDAFAELVWRLAGGHLWSYAAAHVCAQALVGPSVLVICRALALSQRTAWIAVVSTAMLPYFVATAVRQVDVGVVIAVAALFVAAATRWRASGGRSVVMSVIVADAAMLLFLTRADAAAMIAAIYAAILWMPGTLSRRAVLTSIAVLAVLLTMWSGVNMARFGKFTPLPANGGYHLWVGNHPGAAAEIMQRAFNPSDVMAPPSDGSVMNAYESDASAAASARAFMRAHPGAVLTSMLPKIYRYWDPRLDEATSHSDPQRFSYSVPFAIYVPLAVAGAWLLWRRRQRWPLVLLTAVVIGYWSPHLLLYGLIRHRMTVEWSLLILAAIAADRLLPGTRTAYSLHRDGGRVNLAD